MNLLIFIAWIASLVLARTTFGKETTFGITLVYVRQSQLNNVDMTEVLKLEEE